MPSRLRSPLLAFTLTAFVIGSAMAPIGGNDAPSVGVKGAAIRLELPYPTPKRTRHARKPTLGQRAATIALRAVGVPYRWGGSSLAGGFDCSGLVYWTYGRLGIEVPHSSYALFDMGRRVARARMQPGDVLFFTGLGHVGLYLGRGRMVHAPSTGRRVEVVSLGGSNYGHRLIGARRIVS